MEVINSGERNRIWGKALGFYLAVIFLLLFLYFKTFESMVLIWYRSETFTHGFLVLPISLWLIFRKKEIILKNIPSANPWFLFLIIGFVFVWILADSVAVNSVTQLSIVCLLVLSVPAIFGWGITRLILFPLLFLFFSVPIGEFLFPILMDWTANFTVIALRLSGVPVYREGLQFVIPSGNWSVVEACSGVRYLIASLTVGTLFAYLNYKSLAKRLLFVSFSIVIPIFANWLRAYFIVMLGHYSGNKLAVGVDHIIYGWLFFGLVIFIMFVIGAKWADNFHDFETNKGPLIKIPVENQRSKLFLTSGLLFFVLLLPTFYGLKNVDLSPVSFPDNFLISNHWVTSKDPGGSIVPSFSGAAATYEGLYINNSESVGLYVGYYKNQDYKNKMIGSDNSFIKSDNLNWSIIESRPVDVFVESEKLKMRATEFGRKKLLGGSSDSRLFVRQVYWVNGFFVENDLYAKIYSAIQKMLGGRDDSAVVVFYSENSNEIDANEILNKFISDNIFIIRKNLVQMKNI